jgi:hypothetical protein
VKFITEAATMGITLLPPDINESNLSFTVVGDNIRFGLGAVKGVGEGAIEGILEGRRSIGRFTSLSQFCESIDLRTCNKKVLEALIKSGSMDSIGACRKAMFDELERTVDSAAKAKEEKEQGQNNLFGAFTAAMPKSALARMAERAAPVEWPEDEKLRNEKETLGFYITGHPLNKFKDDLKQFSNATTETLSRQIDETVTIGGIIGQLKKSKIKKGRNEGRMMAKFVLDDQYGSVDVVVFSDLYEKNMKWIENGVAVLVTANVKDTGGVAAGRSAALQSAERQAQQISDEYGGHPELEMARASAYRVALDDDDPPPSTGRKVSAYEVREGDGDEEEKTEAELERERVGADVDKFNLSLFGGAPAVAPEPEADVETAPLEELPVNEPTVATAAVEALVYNDAPITPELNALDIVQLDGIREKRVKEIQLELPYAKITDGLVKRMREIIEANPGEVPIAITLIDPPDSLANVTTSKGVRLRINQHFRVMPGPALLAALNELEANVVYSF